MRRTTWIFVALLFGAQCGLAEAGCDSTAPTVLEAHVTGAPFAAVSSADGCTIYVSVTGTTRGSIAVVKRSGGALVPAGEIALSRAPFGLALSHDGSILIAADSAGATFVDVQKNTVLGHIDDGGRGAVYAAVTPDDSLVFLSDELSQDIAVIDLAKARKSGFGNDALIGRIPVGMGPVGLGVSPDGRTLFATVQIVRAPDQPRTCESEQSGGSDLHHVGALIAIDVARARTDPIHAVVVVATAGCNPVRVALSPSGNRAYVTARGSNALLVFDTAKLLAHDAGALVATIPVGKSPVGVVATTDRVIVTNSDRFAAGQMQHQSLIVVDAEKIGQGAQAVIGTVEAGAFPRELHLAADGALLVANAGSNSISVIDLGKTVLTPPGARAP